MAGLPRIRNPEELGLKLFRLPKEVCEAEVGLLGAEAMWEHGGHRTGFREMSC